MRQKLVPFKIQIGILKRTHLKHMHYNALPQTTSSPIVCSPVNQRTVIEKKHFRHHNHCSFICRATDNWKGRCLWLPYALKVPKYAGSNRVKKQCEIEFTCQSQKFQSGPRVVKMVLNTQFNKYLSTQKNKKKHKKNQNC